MRFSTSLFHHALITTAAVAAPLTAQRQARNEARRLARAENPMGNRASNPPYKPGTSEVLRLNTTVHKQYSSNWAGAVLIGTGYSAVTAEFTVPTPHVPWGNSSDKQYCASAWVGIDGDTCTTAILQTGIDFCVRGSSRSYSAWYEWYPDYSHDFSGLDISAGNLIRVSVNATSQTAGTASVENRSTGKSATHTFFGGVGANLCQYNAEWVVEDFQMGGSLVPFANFGVVTFVGAEAFDGKAKVGPSGATLIDIKQNSRVLTSSSVTASSVTVQYV